VPLPGPSNPSAVKPGDVLSYNIEVDLPSLPSSQPTPLDIGIFSLNPLSNSTPFPICGSSFAVQSVGSQIQQSGDVITQTMYNAKNISRVDMMNLNFNSVSTSAEDSGNLNKISVTFSTILVESSEFQSNRTYSIISGVRYGVNDSFIWIGESKLFANFSVRNFDAQGSLIFSPTFLQKGQTSVVIANITITKPATGLTVYVFSPEGLDNQFHFGKPNATLGSSFVCNDNKFWKFIPVLSKSLLSTGKAAFSFPFLLNSDPSRNVMNSGNIITISIPFTVLPTAIPGLQTFVIGFQLDSLIVWSSQVNITVLDTAFVPSLSQPTGLSWTLLNTENIPAGSAAVFQLAVSVEPGSSVELSLEMTALDSFNVVPISAFIADAGFCGLGIGNTSQELTPNMLTTNFGVFTNADTIHSTQVLLQIAYMVQPTATNGIQIVSASIGDMVAQGMMFNVTNSLNQDDVTAVGTPLGFVNASLFPKTEIGMNVQVYVPPASKVKRLNFTALSDEDVTYDLRVCSVSITSIGAGLPCLLGKSFVPTLSKSSSGRTFLDIAQLSFDPLCSANISNNAEDNSFSINVIYELPLQSSIVGNQYVLPGTVLQMENKTIFAAVNGMISKNSSLLVNLELGSNNPDLNQTMPFFTFTDTDSNIPVHVGGIHYTRFIMKTQPKTRGNYQLSFSPGLQNYVCLVKVLKIGKNMPCAKKPEGYIDQYSKTHLDYNGKADGATAQLAFDALTNWGNSTMLLNNYVDDDAIEIGVFIRRNPQTNDLSSGNFNISANLTVGTVKQSVTNTLIKSSTSPLVNNNLNLNPSFVSVRDNDTLDEVFISIPKIIGLQLSVPSTFYGNVNLKFSNLDYESGIFFDFCGAQVTSVGLNLPCTNKSESFSFSTTFETNNNQLSFYDSISITVEITPTLFSTSSQENNIVVEVTIKVPATFTGTEINIGASLDTTGESVSIKIPVTPPTNFVDIPNKEFTIQVNKTSLVSQVGWKQWVSLNVTIPRSMAIPLKIEVFTPSQNGRAIFTVEDARFSQIGSNICCTSAKLNISQLFNVTREATNNITTFMQKDYMSIDMGIVVNGGYTSRSDLEVPQDNQFGLDILIQVTDHPLLIGGSVFYVLFKAKSSNETQLTANSSITMFRNSNRQMTERAFIVFNMTVLEERIYNKGEILNFSTVLFHSNYSRAEGAGNVVVRLIMPVWLGYDSSINSFTTNYTSGTCSTLQSGGDKNNSLSFVFSNGVFFSDYISLNFSLTVDPLDLLGNGRGIVNSSIIAQVHCMSSVFLGFPAASTTVMICGPYMQTSLSVLSPPDCSVEHVPLV